MQFRIIARGDGTDDDLYSLRKFLATGGLDGTVSVVHAAMQPGRLGNFAESLLVTLGPGGAGAALVWPLVTWLRHRTTDVALEVVRPDGSALKVRASRVRGLSGPELARYVTELVADMQPGPDQLTAGQQVKGHGGDSA